jgi:DTW domain-containing protein YfiP
MIKPRAINLAVFVFFSLAAAINIHDVSHASHQRAMIASNIAKSERRENGRSIESTPRTFCDRCRRPAKVCVCQGLPSECIATETQVLVLQHPGEFRGRKTISTTPLIPLVLQNCSISVGYSFEAEDLAPIRDALSRGQRPLLLFPVLDAISLDGKSLPELDEPNASSSEGNTTADASRLLILVDGTWTQARRMIRESPSLISCCQKVEFTSPGNSIYDAIRKEPEEHCLSTLECCAQALLHLEPDSANTHEAAAHLMGALTTLVKQQQQMRLDPVPRHFETADRLFEKKRRRFEIEREMFHDRSITKLEEDSTLRKL